MSSPFAAPWRPRGCPVAPDRCQTRLMRTFRTNSLRAAGVWLVAAAALTLGCEGGSSPLRGNSTLGPVPGAPSGPPMALPTPHACGVRVKEVAVFQAVKVPLVVDGQPVPALNAPIIENRQALFRAYVAFDETGVRGNARARLRLESSQGQWSVEGVGSLNQNSREGQLESTFNFDVGPEYMQGDLRIGVELELGSGCGGGQRTVYPTEGLLALPLLNTGALKVTLVPIAYDADGSGRMPDTSPEQIERYRQTLLAYYPVSDVQITLRDSMRTKISLTAGSGWSQFLDSIRTLRMGDGAPRDVYYYALVSPAATFSAYCSRACIAGLSYLANSPSSLQQVGAGVGFSGALSGDTLAHELGHQHGRGHAPCGAQDGIDGRYPYQQAALGSWGVDFRSGKLMDPATRKDLMSYCDPIWISDYTYSALADRREAVLASARVVQALTVNKPFRGFRSLLAGEDGRPVWGNQLAPTMVPEGAPETAKALDAQGQVVAEVTVYRTDYGHAAGKAASYDVPSPAPGWVSLEIKGQAPIRFSDVPSVPTLAPM
jgi:Peptidase M66